MNTYALLLRGINVGGKNIIPMARLRAALAAAGFENVASYIASGNLVVDTTLTAAAAQAAIDKLLADEFGVDRDAARALVLTKNKLQAVVDGRPRGFGDDRAKYLYDAVFLVGIKAADAMRVFKPADGIDTVTAGNGVIYSRRLAAQRTKSRLNRIIGTAEYRKMTIRNWNTTLKLLELLKGRS